MSQSPRVTLFLRITPSLSERIEAALKTSDPEHPWRTPSKQDFVVGILEGAVPGSNGTAKRNPRQLDIEDVIGGKAKARKTSRKPARAKAARRAKRSKAKA